MRARKDVYPGMLVAKAKRGGWLVPSSDAVAPFGIYQDARDNMVLLMDGTLMRLSTPECVVRTGICRISVARAE